MLNQLARVVYYIFKETLWTLLEVRHCASEVGNTQLVLLLLQVHSRATLTIQIAHWMFWGVLIGLASSPLLEIDCPGRQQILRLDTSP